MDRYINCGVFFFFPVFPDTLTSVLFSNRSLATWLLTQPWGQGVPFSNLHGPWGELHRLVMSVMGRPPGGAIRHKSSADIYGSHVHSQIPTYQCSLGAAWAWHAELDGHRRGPERRERFRIHLGKLQYNLVLDERA